MIILLYFLILSLPFYGFSIVNIGGRGFAPPVWIIAELIIIVFITRIFLRKQKVKINIVGKAILIFNCIAILSLSHLINAETSQINDFFTKWIQLFLWTLLFFSISSLEIKEKDLRNLFRLWLITAFFISLHTIYQAIAINANLQLPLVYIHLNNPSLALQGLPISGVMGHYSRISSVFAEPSYLGSYLISPILLLATELTHKQREFSIFNRYWIKYLIFFTITLALLLSSALSVYITLVMIIPFLLLDKNLRKKSLKALLIILIVTFGIILILQNLGVDFLSSYLRIVNIYNHVASESLSNTSIGQRLACNLRGLKIGMDHFLLGVGLNNVHYYYDTYKSPSWYTNEMGTGTGNQWLQALGEMGILGLIVLMSMWIIPLAKLKKYIRVNQDNKYGFMATAFYYILLANIINSLFTYSYIHIQRWINLSLAVLVLLFIGSLSKTEYSYRINRDNKIIS